MQAGHEHMRQIALGAVDFHRENPSVQIVGDGFNPLVSWARLDQFQGDGLIAIANSEEELERLKRNRVPFVLAGSRFLDKHVSVVASDNRAIGNMAARHLVSCGLKSFLFIGSRKWDDERLRFEGFQEFLVERNVEYTLGDFSEVDFPFRDTTSYGSVELRSLVKILQENDHRPLGVFCPNSFIARATVHACHSLGLVVPDKVAVLAVNDDAILCETSEPPLSSIVQSSSQIGFHAARLLTEQLLDGKSARHLFFPPRRLSVRRSTDVLMVGNETVERALRFMRDNAQSSIEITDIADHVGVSRRTLELKFRETLESTPRQELMRMRLDIARTLLTESEIPITQIALRSGFGGSQIFSTVFKKECGMTPTAFRAQTNTAIE